MNRRASRPSWAEIGFVVACVLAFLLLVALWLVAP